MSDPVVKAIQAGIVSIALSDGACAARLSRLHLIPDAGLDVALHAAGESLVFNRDRVKNLTVSQLKDELRALA